MEVAATMAMIEEAGMETYPLAAAALAHFAFAAFAFTSFTFAAWAAASLDSLDTLAWPVPWAWAVAVAVGVVVVVALAVGTHLAAGAVVAVVIDTLGLWRFTVRPLSILGR